MCAVYVRCVCAVCVRTVCALCVCTRPPVSGPTSAIHQCSVAKPGIAVFQRAVDGSLNSRGPEVTLFTPIKVATRDVSPQISSGYQSTAQNYIEFSLFKTPPQAFYYPEDKEGRAADWSRSETKVVSARPPKGLGARIVSHRDQSEGPVHV